MYHPKVGTQKKKKKKNHQFKLELQETINKRERENNHIFWKTKNKII